MKIGFHCAHEQYAPGALLGIVREAERAGFKAAMSSDHLSPWSVRQGNSGFNWSWLGAALQATSFPFGTLAIPGGWRYHPVIVAQAAATLAEMFPGRLPWIAAGSGEAMNEHVTGAGWPPKEERNLRLEAGVDIIRALWRGETVTRQDGPIDVHSAKIWSRPEVPPKIYGAALSPETAKWIGRWADGMLTTGQSVDSLKKMIHAFHKGGGKGKPVVLQVQLSWAETDGQARFNAWDQWRCAALGRDACANLQTPEEFDHAASGVKPEEMDRYMVISSDLDTHIRAIRGYQALGIDEIYIYNAGKNHEKFLRVFAPGFLQAFH